tara:strand:- start:764 stop:1267 length:504 start_codon:yes stop_codon:yes gene_type:complete
VQALCEGLCHCSLPSLTFFDLGTNKFGPAGAEAFAAALRRGTMPRLVVLSLNLNPIGNRGVAGLVALLRKLPAFKILDLYMCGIGDEGVASLVADLGKDDFKALICLWLSHNNITDAGMATLAAALGSGSLPKLRSHQANELTFLDQNQSSASAVQAVEDALSKRSS